MSYSLKIWSLPLYAIGALGLFSGQQRPQRQVLVLYGRNQGYLSPCGCTYPMSGGIRRAGTVIRQLESQGATFVFVGGNVGGISRQDELKAETEGETSQSLNGLYSFEREEAAMGPGMLLALKTLTRDHLLSNSVEPSAEPPLINYFTSDGPSPVQVGSASTTPELLAAPIGQTARSFNAAVTDLIESAARNRTAPVLITDADEQAAHSMAERFPALRVIVYRSASDPPPAPVKRGDTTLVTTGHHGKNAIALTFENGKVVAYSVLQLGPDVPDDPAISRIYLRYLQRVAAENLLAQVPREKTAKYIDSQACASCHSKPYKIWASSGHARALKDLDEQHHGRDPDCVRCHVVGLNSIYGFKGETQTPKLSNVGCESCHGPSRAHALSPYRFRLPKVQAKQCITCHTTDNSPGFNFALYWTKIKH